MGGGANNWGLGLQLAAGLTEAAGAVTQGRAQGAYYDASAKSARDQARLNELAAERQIAYDTAEKNSRLALLREDRDRLTGQQITAMAAGGLTGGTAMDLITDSLLTARRDIGNLSQTYADRAHETRLQARLASLDAHAQAKQFEIAGKSARRAGWLAAGGSLLGTAAQVALQWPQKPASAAASAPAEYDFDEDRLAKNIKSYAKTQKKAPWAGWGGVK